MRNSIVKAILLGAALLGLTSFKASAQAAAQVVVNESVPVASMDKSELKDILMGKKSYWDGGQAITIVVLTGNGDAALEAATGMTTSSFRTFWQRLTFSGRGKQPKEADSVEKALSLVAENKGAIALLPAGTPVQGVKKVDLK